MSTRLHGTVCFGPGGRAAGIIGVAGRTMPTLYLTLIDALRDSDAVLTVTPVNGGLGNIQVIPVRAVTWIGNLSLKEDA